MQSLSSPISVLLVAAALFACNPGGPLSPGVHRPEVAHGADHEAAPVVGERALPPRNPPQVPADFVAPTGMRTYYIVMLKRGPAWSAEATPANVKLGQGHRAYIEQQAKAGTLRVAGPFLGQTDSDDYAGIYIYDVGSLEQAKALVHRDPAVAAGRFEPEYLVWMASKGLRVGNVAAKPSEPAETALPPICTGVGYGDFDFWVGNWTVRNTKGEVVGHNSIAKQQRGCALIESWASTKGGTGTSITYFEPTRKVWLQTWVDSRGSVILLEGALEDGAIKLGGTYTKKDGTSTALRGSWRSLLGGKLRQHLEESKDGGLTWSTWFDGSYERR